MARVGPVVMSVAGDTFIQPARISSVLWDGVSTSGDSVELVERESGLLLWAARTASTITWEGMVFGHDGLHAPTGFTLSKISSGRLLVYLKEG